MANFEEEKIPDIMPGLDYDYENEEQDMTHQKVNIDRPHENITVSTHLC